MGKYDAAIDKGIALLDAQVPDWCTKMQLERLDIADPNNCVLGQVFEGDLYQSTRALGIEDLGKYAFNATVAWIDEAFEGDTDEGVFRGLTEAWKQRIRQHCEVQS